MRSFVQIVGLLFAQSCCSGQIGSRPMPEKTEVFSSAGSDACPVKVYRRTEGGRTGFEIELGCQGRRSSRQVSVADQEAIAVMGFRGPVSLMDRLRLQDVRIDPASGDLLVIVDKFGFVDVLRYRRGPDLLFSAEAPEVLPLRSYELVPADVQLQGEHIEDVALAQGKIIAMTASGYRHFGSYFISMLNLERKTVTEFRIGSLDIRKVSKEIRDESMQQLTALPVNDTELLKVLNAVKAKGGFADVPLRMRFALLSGAFRASFAGRGKVAGNALFFVEIGGKPMVMLYTNLNEWYIAPEEVLKREVSNARHSRSEIERLFLYQ